MKSAVSIAKSAAAKRHTSLCGCAHHVMLRGRFIWRTVYFRRGFLFAGVPVTIPFTPL